MSSNDMMMPARFPDTYYYGIQPMVSNIVAEMDDMSVAYPTQGMYETMVDRAYNQAMGMFPDEFQEESGIDQNSDNPDYHAEQFFPRRRRVFRDLLGVLILFELFNRRRFHW